MKRLQRITAMLLCVLMLVPTQGLTIWAEGVHPPERIEAEAPAPERIEAEALAPEAEAKAPEAEAPAPEAEAPEVEAPAPEVEAPEEEAPAPEAPEAEAPEQDRIEETRPLEPTTGAGEASGDRVEETLPLEPTTGAGEASGDRVEETLPLEPTTGTGEESGDRVEETLPLEPTTGAGEASGDRVEETLPLEPPTDAEGEEEERLEETLPLEIIEEESDGVIYWNPGGQVPEGTSETTVSGADEATASDATKASGSETRPSADVEGNDRAGGRSPAAPVKTLKRAIALAERMQRKKDIDPSEIIIYAMSPMEIPVGEVHTVDGRGVSILPWDGREAEDKTIFHLTGGQLMLKEVSVGAEDTETAGEDNVIRAEGGILRMAANVTVNGRLVLDYRSDRKEQAASPAEAGGALPVIELAEGFEGSVGGYVLEVLSDDRHREAELVRTLYADGKSPEDFMETFRLAEDIEEEWELKANEEDVAQLRDTGLEETTRYRKRRSVPMEEPGQEAETSKGKLTRKILVAQRATSGTVVYWNPGGPMTIAGTSYPAGRDEGVDGSTTQTSFKTWQKAREAANGGTVICMQTATLSDISVPNTEGFYELASSSRQTRVTIAAWEPSLKPVLHIQAGDKLRLENVELTGLVKGGVMQNLQMILCEGGDIRIGEGVLAQYGYIQMHTPTSLKDHPITVDSTPGSQDKITLFFAGINEDLSYRYLDVIKPAGALAAQALTDAATVGQSLAVLFELEESNRLSQSSNQSKIPWTLRPDADEDLDDLHPENLELYADFYFAGIYLDEVRGDDTNYGATCQFPVKTWERARQIWAEEIDRSIQARVQAAADGHPKDYIDRLYPLTKRIYICSTMTVNGTETWWLEPKIDYNKNTIQTEVVSHTEIPMNGQTGALVHELPKSLIQVLGGAVLTLENIKIRNITNQLASSTIEVQDGGALHLTKGTVLNGERDKTLEQPAASVTLGTHIQILDGGQLTIEGATISSRSHGVSVNGARASVVMNSGSISHNSVPSSVMSGGGVVIKGGASFTMNGGRIYSNRAYLRGGGVYLEGLGSNFSLRGGQVNYNSLALDGSGSQGAGIYSGAGTIVNIKSSSGKPEDAKVSSNYGYRGAGMGIYSLGELNIDAGCVTDNHIEFRTNDNRASTGIGIYVGGTGILNMNNGLISNNTSDSIQGNSGAGITINGSRSLDNVITNSQIVRNGCSNNEGGGIAVIGGTIRIQGTTIADNYADEGGGIYQEGTSQVLLKEGTEIKENKAENGGGIYQKGDKSSNFPPRLEVRGSEAVPVRITSNTALASGGGIGSNLKTNIFAEHMTINGNQAEYGGGMSLFADGAGRLDSYMRNVNIVNNKAGISGGGIYTIGARDNEVGWRNIIIANNEAGISGGGIYAEGRIHLSEDTPGASSITKNTAGEKGGGIYSGSESFYGDIRLDIAGPYENIAGEQGSNIYAATNLHLLQGEFLPPSADAVGVYNIYCDIQSDNARIYLDPSRVTVGKKAGEQADAIYLNTANSYLTYLAAPGTNAYKTMPIDLNLAAFQVGSIVIKPANLSKVTLDAPNAATNGRQAHTIDYPLPLQDATTNLDYSSGGIVPQKTQLGGFRDANNPAIFNAILVGEGVYLGGTEGDDSWNGTGPTNSVATFERAKELLKKRVEEAAADPKDLDGFSPFIYICGPVKLSGNHNWALDYTSNLFTVTNQKYVESEEVEGKTAAPAQVLRFASYVEAPMVQIGANHTESASLTLGSIIINGMAEGVVTSMQGSNSPILRVMGSSQATLTGESQVTNNYDCGIESYGTLLLEGAEDETNKQLLNHSGSGVRLSTTGEIKGSLRMTEYSRIVQDDSRTVLSDMKGVELQADTRMIMEDNSQITGEQIAMGYGIDAFGSNQIQMNDSTILNNLRTAIYLRGDSTVFIMNGNQDASETDSAVIKNATAQRGIDIRGKKNQVALNKQAKIDGGAYGIYIETKGSDVSELSKNEIILKDNSSIRYSLGGIYAYSSNNLYVEMSGQAAIEGCTKGVQEAKYLGDGFVKLLLDMKGSSRISGNKESGVSLDKEENSDAEDCEIRIQDNAVIGGNKRYLASDLTTGNGWYGIFAATPIRLDMKDNAAIKYNGLSGVLGTSKSYNSSGKGSISLTDYASISNNGGSGISTTPNNGYTTNYTVRMSAQSSSTGNSNGSYIYGSGICHLEDLARLDRLSCGKLYLDGTVVVEGEISLNYGQHPIVMTSPVTDPLNQFKLVLSDGFLGQKVVTPDGVTMISVTDQLPYFKGRGTGMAYGKKLLAASPNIILEGDNNVYLSGGGSDGNDGSSPSTAVRTFKRARERLQTGPYTEGANVIISSEVKILSGDLDWSFDPGGKVTNTTTGRTWRPLVKRLQGYAGRMISATDKRGLTFRDITIDGGSKNGMRADSEMLHLWDSTTTLGEGMVLQNNQKSTQGGYNGVYVLGGKLTIDGATIRGMDSSGGVAAVYARNNAAGATVSVYLKSGLITENSNRSHGSIIRFEKLQGNNIPSFYMSGGSIENNSITGNVVNIYDTNAEISGGSIRDNKILSGRAISYSSNASSRLILSGGQISGNTPSTAGQEPIGKDAPIYIDGPNFQLKGGGCNVTDAIYLSSTENNIKVSGNIYQSGRRYDVFLNQGTGTTQYKKGSVVVEPLTGWMTDVTPYQGYFRVHSNPYVLDRGQSSAAISPGAGVAENKCLLLMKAVYLDSQKGNDSNDGTTPAQAVKTFSRAKAIGRQEQKTNYYIIFVSGKAVNTRSEPIWSMPAPAYMCRYTGFPVYNPDGSETTEEEHTYTGVLIEPAHPLTFRDIAVYGRRSIDGTDFNGDSLVQVKDGIQVTVAAAPGDVTVFGRNNNTGEVYDYETNIWNQIRSQGGAFLVDGGGSLTMTGGSISETAAALGGAVYLGTEETKRGELHLAGSPLISGKVHLTGKAQNSSYLSVEADYAPAQALQLSVGDDYMSRAVIQYPQGMTPGITERQHFLFDSSIQGLYEIVNRENAQHILELSQRGVIYLDGQDGDDNRDGQTPRSAFKTIRKAYETIKAQQMEGTVVYVVGSIDITTEITLGNIEIREADGSGHFEGYYQEGNGIPIDERGQIYFKRYSQPTAHEQLPGFNVASLMDPLFIVKSGGKLSLNGIYIDGHAEEVESSSRELTAEGVKATSPLLLVETGSELICSMIDTATLAGGISTPTLVTNNINTRRKENQIGTLEGAVIYEGSSAGIEILGGKVTLQSVQFSNLQLGGEVVSGGTDIYNHGELHLSTQTFFMGSVFLEGFGTREGNHDTSRFIQVDKLGTPLRSDFQVLMRDAYDGRKVVEFIPGDPGAAQIANYRLEEVVKHFFYLTQNETDKSIYELRVPQGVYVDGINGDDAAGTLNAGSVPDRPVKTLKRAFELMKTRTSNTIYIVDTVPVSAHTSISGTEYQDPTDRIVLGSTDKVTLLRYIQPDFAKADQTAAQTVGYTREDFTGPLIEIRNNASLTVGEDVYIDGHSETREDKKYDPTVTVTRKTQSKAPLIKVNSGGELKLQPGSVLLDNQNTYDSRTETGGMEGGAIYNSGTVTTEQTEFRNITAVKGSLAYQDGTFTIASGVNKLPEHASFYLTTTNSGTAAAPVWGTDHIIQIGEALQEGQKLDIDMDHPVKGRDVIRFTDTSAYETTADSEYGHFMLSPSVPDYLYLMGAELDDSLLELQNWERLDVEIPADMYLVINRKGSMENSTKLSAIQAEAAESRLLTAPVYTIKNSGAHTVKVSVSGFSNQNAASSITHDTMTLKDQSGDAEQPKDLYLAIQGMDKTQEGFTLTETPLSLYAKDTVPAPAFLGTLASGKSGTFTFIGAVGSGFVDHYKDPGFPVEGKTKEEVQQYLSVKDENGRVNARARYALTYRLDIVPARR